MNRVTLTELKIVPLIKFNAGATTVGYCTWNPDKTKDLDRLKRKIGIKGYDIGCGNAKTSSFSSFNLQSHCLTSRVFYCRILLSLPYMSILYICFLAILPPFYCIPIPYIPPIGTCNACGWAVQSNAHALLPGPVDCIQPNALHTSSNIIESEPDYVDQHSLNQASCDKSNPGLRTIECKDKYALCSLESSKS